jgi:tetratricopeptide (TPR) repeat protein
MEHGNKMGTGWELLSGRRLINISFEKMKLRCSFSSRQRLLAFGFGLAALLLLDSGALAQDKITSRGQTQDVKIIGVSGASVQIQVGNGTLGVPLATITSVVKAAPPEVEEASRAYEARDYAKALSLAKGVKAKFLGLPVDWAQQASSLVGDIYVAQGQLKEAEAAYAEYQRAYPKASSVQVDVGMARIALSRNNLDEAKAKLEPIAEAARKAPFQTGPDTMAYSQTFYLLGKIAEARRQPALALENYLRTVTVFYRDASAVKLAQERADALRMQDPSLAIP